MGSFEAGESTWVAKLGNLRSTIRQELIGRQLDHHIAPSATVLDVGCGQGTQGLRLMNRSCVVTGIDPSPELLALYEQDALALDVSPELLPGDISQLDALLGDRTFDAVCAHGVLMYLDDPAQAIATLSERVASDGLLSITFKNAHGLAMRPALRGEWTSAIAAFDETTYHNELGVDATAHRLEEVEEHLKASGLAIDEWYGIRVFNDAISGTINPPRGGRLDPILKAEELASRTDPYRWLGSQFHVIASRSKG